MNGATGDLQNHDNEESQKEYTSPLDQYNGPKDYIQAVEKNMYMPCTIHEKHHSQGCECQDPWLLCNIAHENPVTGHFYCKPIHELLGYNPLQLALLFAAGSVCLSRQPDSNSGKSLHADFCHEIVDNILWKYLKLVHTDKRLVDLKFQHFCLKYDAQIAAQELLDFEQKHGESLEMYD